jgi:poly-gamma-glutamate capsule biosynthesis protein CapA/YwtB (metallophosphatase superfamily)
LFGQKFVAGDGYAKASFPNEFDVQLNLKWIADARRMADWVVVSMHNQKRGATLDEPAEFARTFAHSCIDAGADVVFGHGPHQDRGIEIYHEKPILYALGNFVLHNDAVRHEGNDRQPRRSQQVRRPVGYAARAGRGSFGFPSG